MRLLILALSLLMNYANSKENSSSTDNSESVKITNTQTKTDNNTPKNWIDESNSVYRLLMSTFQYENANFGNVDELIELANTHKSDELYFKAYNAAMHQKSYKKVVDIVGKWSLTSKSDLSLVSILSYTLNENIEESFEIAQENFKKNKDKINQYLVGLYSAMTTRWENPNILKLSEKIYEEYPKSVEVASNHANLLRLQLRANEAATVLDKVIFYNPKRLGLYKLKSDTFKYDFQLEKSEKVWLDLLKDYPLEQKFSIAYGDFLYESHQFDKAVTLFKSITDTKLKPFADDMLMMAYIKLKNLVSAESVFDFSIMTEEEKNNTYFKLAVSLIENDFYLDGEKVLAKMSNNIDTDSSLYADRKMSQAVVEYKKGKKEGDVYFDKIAKELKFFDMDFVLNKSKILVLADNRNAAYELLDKALLKEPKNTGILYEHSLAADYVGKYDVSIDDLELLLQIMPNNSNIQNALGYMLINSDYNVEKGIKLAEKGLYSDSFSPAILDSVGWGYYKLEQYDKAVKYLHFAYSEYNDIEIVGHYILALHKAGEAEKAKALYQLESKVLKPEKLDKYITEIKPELTN